MPYAERRPPLAAPWRRAGSLATWLTLSLLAPNTLAAAPSLDQCLAASDAAQARRDEGRYTEARALTLTCASEACPAIVRRNCEKWRSEIETSMPTVVLVARRADGATEASASVLVDGVALLSRLTGTPVAVDPGERRFTFRLGEAVAEVKTLVAAGTKNQLVEARFGVGSPSPSQAASPAAVVDAPPSEPPSPRRGPPVASLALGALGVAGVGAFAYFAATAKGDLNAIERAPCAATKTCPESETDSIRTRFLVGDIALGAGLVSLGLATWLWLDASPKKASATVTVVPGLVAAAFSAPLP